MINNYVVFKNVSTYRWLKDFYCVITICLGDSKVLRASVWKPRSNGSNPRQTQIEPKIQNLLHLLLRTFLNVNLAIVAEK